MMCHSEENLQSQVIIGPTCSPQDLNKCHRCGAKNPLHLIDYSGCGCTLLICCNCAHPGEDLE